MRARSCNFQSASFLFQFIIRNFAPLFQMDMAKKTEEELFRRLDGKVVRALRMYGLIADGDKVLIGLSGGKDSLALMELLGRRARIYRPKFTLVAAHVRMRNIPYEVDETYLRRACEAYNIPLIVEETEFDPSTDTRRTPCFLCSWMRRKALFEIAKRMECRKIALGHHQDDILETLLLNLTHQGSFGTMPPKLRMKKFDMEIIRPLCLISEAELATLAQLQHYQKQVKNCPYENLSSRSSIKRIFRELETIQPDVRHSLWNSMTNVQTEYLPQEVQM